MKILIYYFIVLSFCISISANGQLLPFRNFGVKDGLTNTNVKAMIRDDRGLLWIGTDFSINWFDGKRFYKPEIKTNIGQLLILNFYEDLQHDIWALTFFNGLYKFHDGEFTNYLIDTISKDAVTNTISGMVQVEKNKYIVIGIGVVYWFDGNRYTLFDSTNVQLVTNANNVVILPDETILLSTENGIFEYKYNSLCD